MDDVDDDDDDKGLIIKLFVFVYFCLCVALLVPAKCNRLQEVNAQRKFYLLMVDGMTSELLISVGSPVLNAV